jgi:hypothetical protein
LAAHPESISIDAQTSARKPDFGAVILRDALELRESEQYLILFSIVFTVSRIL